MKTRLKHMTAALLTLIMIIGLVPLNAFAWGTEGEVCSSKFGSAYVGYDGGKYYSASKIDFIAYDSNGNISKHTKAGGNARRRFIFTNAAGAEHQVYCVESGIDFTSSNNGYTSSSGSNSRYFQNLPKAAREGIMLTTVYGWQEGLNTPVAGTNNDDYALATQVIIWEYQQQLRTSPTRIVENNGIPADHYFKTIQGRPAEKCYNWILEQCAKHLVVPKGAVKAKDEKIMQVVEDWMGGKEKLDREERFNALYSYFLANYRKWINVDKLAENKKAFSIYKKWLALAAELLYANYDFDSDDDGFLEQFKTNIDAIQTISETIVEEFASLVDLHPKS